MLVHRLTLQSAKVLTCIFTTGADNLFKHWFHKDSALYNIPPAFNKEKAVIVAFSFFSFRDVKIKNSTPGSGSTLSINANVLLSLQFLLNISIFNLATYHLNAMITQRNELESKKGFLKESTMRN